MNPFFSVPIPISECSNSNVEILLFDIKFILVIEKTFSFVINYYFFIL